MDFGEDFSLFEIILILGIVGAIGYGIYYVINNLGGSSPDPGGGAPSTGALSTILNQLDVGASSSSFSDAAQEVVSNPFTSAKTILGGWYNDLTGGDESD